MVVAARDTGPIEIDRIFLYEENPRHEPIETEPEIIEHLCKDRAGSGKLDRTISGFSA
jgi:hypothetical protein